MRRDGKFVREIAYLPLAEDIPVAFNSCRKGPRSLGWRDDKPAELYWAEAQVSHLRQLARLTSICGRAWCQLPFPCHVQDCNDIAQQPWSGAVTPRPTWQGNVLRR